MGNQVEEEKLFLLICITCNIVTELSFWYTHTAKTRVQKIVYCFHIVNIIKVKLLFTIIIKVVTALMPLSMKFIITIIYDVDY